MTTTVHPSIKIESLQIEEPLDALLLLISKNKYDIFDIPIADICAQYMAYLDVLAVDNIEVASEFLEMAARLVYIKTASLLPKNEEAEQLRKQLSQELMEHSVAKLAAGYLRELARFDTFSRQLMPYEGDLSYNRTHSISLIASAYLVATGKGKAKQAQQQTEYKEYNAKPIISVGWGEQTILDQLAENGPQSFETVLKACSKRGELVAVFIALLELLKIGKIIVDEQMIVYITKPEDVFMTFDKNRQMQEPQAL